ncbi:hypothetical protein ABI59_20910 [Acidobacteria bacterium Mor1]|nr:hypothetical protein ABI59_20910 [Acidobacteria bacterium Mor1]
MKLHRALLPAILLSALVGIPHAGVELVLEDDTLLVGDTVERDEGYYLLTLASGEVVTLPVPLVREVRLFEGELRDDESTTVSPIREPGFVTGKGSDVGPNAGPESLPKVADQLEVFGEPPAWRPAPTDPFWLPDSDWTLDPSQNDFNPVRWYQAPTDPEWIPGGEFNERPDALNSSRSRWRRFITNPYWVPSNGFNNRFSVFD